MSNAQAAKKNTGLFIFDGAGAHLLTFATPYGGRLDESSLEVLRSSNRDGHIFFGSQSPHAVGLFNSLVRFGGHGDLSLPWGLDFFSPPAYRILMAKLKEAAARFVERNEEREDQWVLTQPVSTEPDEVRFVTRRRRTLTENFALASRPAPIFSMEVLYRERRVRYVPTQRGYYTDLALRIERLLAKPEARARQRAKGGVSHLYGGFTDRHVS